uniref:ShKT domain-containing protein n=1 Tax=Caenorhabditis tropicalis TaxID=1561998 RepID=A0A1I7U5E8_9PELO
MNLVFRLMVYCFKLLISDDFIPTIDSTVRLDNTIPEPPSLPIELQFVRKTIEEPHPPASFPIAPPAAQVAPPSIRPPETFSTSTSTPSSVSTNTMSEQNKTTLIPYDDIQITVDIENVLAEPVDDLEEFQKADLLGKENFNDVKNLVKNKTMNTTDDYYITSSASTTNSTTTSTTPKSTTTTPLVTTTTELMTTGSQKKTCIHVKELKTVDDSVVVQAGVKMGKIEASVELGEEDDDEDNDDDSSEEEETTIRKVRDNKKPVVWKKFEMNCDEEVDDKGKICKLWAAGGLCGTHKPTMFLFCRRTCLCVGPN